MPYRLDRQADGLRHMARLWWWLTGLGMVLAVAIVVALASGVFTRAEGAFFTGLGAVLGLVAGARARRLCLQAQRLQHVHALWQRMDNAPRAWRQFALARQAYEYAHQDDTIVLRLATAAFAFGALALVGSGAAFVLGHRPGIAVWTAVGLWIFGAGVWLVRVGLRYRARKALMQDLGPMPRERGLDLRRVA